MLYLIEDRDYLKIGFTTDLEQRISSYKTTNCYAKLIDSKPGSRLDEKALHLLCEQYHYNREWFYNNDEVKNIWNNYKSNFYENFKEIDESNKKAINVLFKCKDLRCSKVYQALQKQSSNIATYKSKETYKLLLNEIPDLEEKERCTSIYNTAIALNKLYFNLFSSNHPDFNYNFGKIEIIITSEQITPDEIKIKETINRFY